MIPKLLAIDDNEVNRRTIVNALRVYDCVVVEACNGIDGMDMAAFELPDVILLDYSMPLMDGSEMLIRLRSDPTLSQIPVIMATSHADRETVMRIAKLGVRGYLVKPVLAKVLVDALRRIIDLKLKPTFCPTEKSGGAGAKLASATDQESGATAKPEAFQPVPAMDATLAPTAQQAAR